MKRPGYVVLLRIQPDADPAVANGVRFRNGWRIVAETERMLVAAQAHLAVGGDAKTAITLGTVFGESGPDRTGGLSCLRDLTRRVWGAYVSATEGADMCNVMRDPSGRMPCFSTVFRGWRLFAAELDDLRIVGWQSTGVDWAALAALLQEPRIRDGRTTLEGVTELLPGEAMNAAGERALVWSPVTLARDEIDSVDEGRAVLREAILGAVSAWAATSSRILHLLSGGLDSSIVLACLAEADFADRVACLHFTRGPDSELDERRYARLAAARAGVDLCERTFDPRALDLSRALEFTDAPRPLGYAYSIENDDFEMEAAEAWRADACFSAAGGDGLFYQLQAKVYCADYLRRRGVGPGLARVAYDSARLIRSSVWSTLYAGWKFADGSFDPASSARNVYLAKDAGGSASGWFNRHPWGRDAKDLSSGKKLHLWALLDSLNFTYDYRRAQIAQTILPLVSQPVIEAVLRIPSYNLCSGGTDRTLVRAAFANDLPEEIINRSGKGAMDGYYAEVCAANAPLIRDRLLGGVLSSTGLLDRERIERDMPRAGEPVDGSETYLLKLFAAEAWASAWR